MNSEHNTDSYDDEICNSGKFSGPLSDFISPARAMRAAIEGPVQYKITIMTKNEGNTSCSRTTFSHPEEKRVLKSYLNGKEPTLQVYDITDGSTPQWVQNVNRGLVAMGYSQYQNNPDWYKTNGEAHWHRTI